MSRRLLQYINAITALLTIILASMSLIFGTKSPVYGNVLIPELPALDSNLRFFGGLGLGIGILLLWITPTIEKQTLLFRSLWICAILGGIGRIGSMFIVGNPPKPMLVFAIIEVPLGIILLYWQSKVSKATV